MVLHPFPMDASFWGPMWSALDTDARLLTPEFPGFGTAPAEDAPTIAGFADAVAEQIVAEGAAPAVVVGLSLGGYVALALVHSHPELVAALLLANTKAGSDDEAARRGRETGIDTIRIDGLGAFLDGLLPRLLDPDADTEAWARTQAIAERQDPEAVCQALEALRDRQDRRPELPAIAVPTLAVAGEHDQITPREVLGELADAIPEGELRVIAGAGHLSALERPEAFAGVVRELLQRVAGTS